MHLRLQLDDIEKDNPHVRINSRNTCVGDRRRQRGKPPFGDPFKTIRTPYFHVTVGFDDWHDNIRILWDKNFIDFFSVEAFDWVWKRHHDVCSCPNNTPSVTKRRRGFTRTFWTGRILEGKGEGFPYRRHRDMEEPTVRRDLNSRAGHRPRWPRDEGYPARLDVVLVNAEYDKAHSMLCPWRQM